MPAKAAAAPYQASRRFDARVPLRRFLQPAEVAHLAVYLASPYSSATTGAALRVDGGVVDSLAI